MDSQTTPAKTPVRNTKSQNAKTLVSVSQSRSTISGLLVLIIIIAPLLTADLLANHCLYSVVFTTVAGYLEFIIFQGRSQTNILGFKDSNVFISGWGLNL